MVTKRLYRHVLPAAVLLCGIARAPAFETVTLECEPTAKGMASVADETASGGESVALAIGDEGSGEAGRWALPVESLEPGLYRFSARARLLIPDDYDVDRLSLSLVLADGKGPAGIPLSVASFDGRTGEYTVFEAQCTFTRKVFTPNVRVSWTVAHLPVGEKPRPARLLKAPPIGGAPHSGVMDVLGDEGNAEADALEALILSQEAVAVSTIEDPTILVDRLELTCITHTLAVEEVWPDKIHVYPGEPNDVNVTVRNYSGTPRTATIRLTLRTGLAEGGRPMEATVRVPADGVAQHRFEWKSDTREFGHEARVDVMEDGQRVHAASEYFSVGTPIWKTAIQGSGFIDWYYCEDEIEQHVAAVRRGYMNVEEAFCWQPCSWTDLNPTNAHWFAGQNNFHNTMAGLREWLGRSHTNGIKLISYLYGTANGPAGVENIRKDPQLAVRMKVGLKAMYDVEDLRLYGRRVEDPTLWREFRPDIWHNFRLHTGLIETSVLGADEVVQSAKRFGWDGVRYDMKPTWGPQTAESAREEYERLGLTDLIRELVPEYYDGVPEYCYDAVVNKNKWSGSAVSIRNMRYMKHRFWSEVSPRFAVSANWSSDEMTNTNRVTEKKLCAFDYFRDYCRGGCQVNPEALRKCGRWSQLLDRLPNQVQFTRQCGGYHAMQSIDKAAGSEASLTFMNLFIFASGSHPYGYAPAATAPGNYSRFMTRYGEYCWSPDLAPLPPDKAGVSVESTTPLFWERFIRTRTTADGKVQTVVQLISIPRVDTVRTDSAFTMPAWQKNVVVRKRGRTPPALWRLSAEPELVAERLPVRRENESYAATLPEHRLWTILVWEEQSRNP